MTASPHATFRTVIFQPADGDGASPAARLLRDLGHEVRPARTADDAVDMARGQQTDLMVLDLTGLDDAEAVLTRVGELTAEDRPRQITVFSDRADDRLRNLCRGIGAKRAHLFIKPLHVHGLLNVLRQLEPEPAGV